MTLLEELNQLISGGAEFPDAMMNLSSKHKLAQEEYDDLIRQYDNQCVNHRIPKKKSVVELLVEKALDQNMKISVDSDEGLEVIKSTDCKEIVGMIDNLEESTLDFYKDKKYLGSVFIVDNEIHDFADLPVISFLVEQALDKKI